MSLVQSSKEHLSVTEYISTKASAQRMFDSLTRHPSSCVKKAFESKLAREGAKWESHLRLTSGVEYLEQNRLVVHARLERVHLLQIFIIFSYEPLRYKAHH